MGRTRTVPIVVSCRMAFMTKCTLRCIGYAEFLLWILSVVSSSDIHCDCSLRGVVVKIDTSVAAEKVSNN